MADTSRSLAAALNVTPEVAEFIHGANRRPVVAESAVTSTAAAPAGPATPRSEKRPKSAPRQRRERNQSAAAPPRTEPPKSRAKVAITTRFSQATADALRRASLERKLRDESLHTQQDIIELAVSNWLRRGGKAETADQ